MGEAPQSKVGENDWSMPSRQLGQIRLPETKAHAVAVTKSKKTQSKPQPVTGARAKPEAKPIGLRLSKSATEVAPESAKGEPEVKFEISTTRQFVPCSAGS
jgi:hypothetical protein